MKTKPRTPVPAPTRWLRQPDQVYALVLFFIGAAMLYLATNHYGTTLGDQGWGTALFFLFYGLFTIAIGYSHPKFGHISFDRVAQVASILVLGPIDAAWINGLASLIYPWHRLLNREPFSRVLTAALNNSGLMAIMILLSGPLYSVLGGTVPLNELAWTTVAALLALMASMQILNDLGMRLIVYFQGRDLSGFLGYFGTTVELSAAAIGVLVALIFNRMELEVFVLLLGVLSLGMLTLKQLAQMRIGLEALVEERTQALREKTLELEQQATHDKLTGLFNRRYADDYLEKEIENSKRYKYDFTIALADIDFFKRINDQFSHAKGDEVLQSVSNILKARCRKTDMIARYGGEEFLLCFPGSNTVAAKRLCEELRIAIEGQNWSSIAPGIKVTLSFGVAENWQESRPKTMLEMADGRLYQAKYKGRNLVVA